MHEQRRIPSLLSALALAAPILLAACAKDYGVSTSFDPLTRFPATASFVWDDRESSVPDDPRLAELGLDRVIREVAAAEFAARGYTETTGASHYLLSYRLDVKTWHGAERSAAVASLSLQLVERASRRQVWSGFARADLHVGNTDAERRDGLRRVMAEMLEDFPPSQRSG
jgi:hypothetical protein